MKLYRAISKAEKNDYESTGEFRTARNTLEGKQFFKSEIAVREFAKTAEIRNYNPPYILFLIIQLDDDCFDTLPIDNQILDGYEAITIVENNLQSFSNCVNLVSYNDL